MQDDGSVAGVDRGDFEEPRRRSRPKPPRRGTDTNENSRRRLGRFFADEQDCDAATPLPDHFPGVPRPELVISEPEPPSPRPRPKPPASRPRPGRNTPPPR